MSKLTTQSGRLTVFAQCAVKAVDACASEAVEEVVASGAVLTRAGRTFVHVCARENVDRVRTEREEMGKVHNDACAKRLFQQPLRCRSSAKGQDRRRPAPPRFFLSFALGRT